LIHAVLLILGEIIPPALELVGELNVPFHGWNITAVEYDVNRSRRSLEMCPAHFSKKKRLPNGA
jgi:hypothetical protein